MGCAVFHYDYVVKGMGLCQVKRNFLRGKYEFPRNGKVIHFHVPRKMNMVVVWLKMVVMWLKGSSSQRGLTGEVLVLLLMEIAKTSEEGGIQSIRTYTPPKLRGTDIQKV